MLWYTLGAVVLVAVWEGIVRWRNVRRFVLLKPSEMVSTFADDPGFYLDHVWVTARHVGVGLAISLAVSVVFGAVLAAWPALEAASQPLLVLIMVTPWVAYITSVVLWLGSGTPSIVFLVAFVTVPAFVYATVAGMRSADPAARELFASIDAGPAEVLWRLRLPAALPSLFTAARFNVGLGLAAAYYSEGSAFTRAGLGAIGKRAANANQGAALWTTICCAALLGIAAQFLVLLAERWLLRWHASQRLSPVP
ncbi:MAG TPA: ABC transporter permease subunit [Ilumatobacter sp.]|nr:ABC transporter permease subunit [Ilumatobacter sp.]